MAAPVPYTVVVCDAGPLIHLDEVGCLELLNDAVELAERHNPYVAAYLVLECAPSLRQQTNGLMLTIVDRMSLSATRLGFTLIAQRLASLRSDLPGRHAA